MLCAATYARLAIMTGRQAATVSADQRDAEPLPNRPGHARTGGARPELDVVGTRRQEQRVIRAQNAGTTRRRISLGMLPNRPFTTRAGVTSATAHPPALRTLHMNTNVRSMGSSSHFDTRLEGSLVGP